jgi:hypothetical protein
MTGPQIIAPSLIVAFIVWLICAIRNRRGYVKAISPPSKEFREDWYSPVSKESTKAIDDPLNAPLLELRDEPYPDSRGRWRKRGKFCKRPSEAPIHGITN